MATSSFEIADGIGNSRIFKVAWCVGNICDPEKTNEEANRNRKILNKMEKGSRCAFRNNEASGEKNINAQVK
jgi:hypothetical protein